MGPEIETNIDSVLRSMEHVILPALDRDHQLAQEQGHAIMVYLRLIRDQHRRILHFRLQEIREYHGLVSGLLDMTDAVTELDEDARQALATATPLLALDLPTYEHLAATAQQLRDVADRLVETIADAPARKQAARLLLAQAQAEAIRERSWVAQLGLDPDPARLVPLDQIGTAERA